MDLRVFMRCGLLLAVAALAAGCQKQAKVSASCRLTPMQGMDCRIENHGPDAASACFDAVVKCSRGDRTAKFCSTRIEAKKSQMQSVAAMKPPIELRETCYQAELHNLKVRPE
jgi:hypothetical protein